MHELRYRPGRRRPSREPALPSDATPRVGVVCVSNRPSQLEHVLAMFDAQTWTDKHLVLVTNAADYDTSAAAGRAEVEIVDTEPRITLGECLNRGFASTDGDVIVRFDDDDLYSRDHLQSVVDVFCSVDAHVTGKAEYFAYIESEDRTVRRFPNRSRQYVGRVAGGSLAVLAPAVEGIEFPHENLGEDVEYVRRCERAGLRVWSSAPQGFLQMRVQRGDHTWKISDADFAEHSEPVGSGNHPELWT